MKSPSPSQGESRVQSGGESAPADPAGNPAAAAGREPRERQGPDPSLLASALEAMGEGIALADATGRIVYSNPASDRLLGTTGTDASPEDWAAHYGVFLPGTDEPFPTDQYPLVRAVAGEETDGVEMLIRNPAIPAGALISVTGRPVRDPEGRIFGAAVVFRDVTGLRAAEEDLRRALRELQESERGRTELTGFLVHDMKGPLAAVMAGAELLLDGATLAPADREGVENLQAAAQSLHRMVLDMLDVHAAQDGQLEPEFATLPVPGLLGPAAAAARVRGADVTVEVIGDLSVEADRALLQRVLGNLVDNCIRHGPEGGRVHLEARAGPSGYVRISVRDEGPGIPEELRERIFDKYARLERDAERSRSGSRGLGLRFCKVAVEAHGGRIWVEDSDPVGAVFCLEIPAALAG